MGIVRTRGEAQQVAPVVLIPFHEVNEWHLRTAAIGEAASWFLRRGYVVSIPLTVTQYDLVTESDEGFVRVQVKSTTGKDKGGRWAVGISRMEYGAGGKSNANGLRHRRPYRLDEVDMFFILTGGGEKYLIPLSATGGSLSLTLDDKYAAYKVG
jgi:PD-(D/E)XK endonuclease